jgi:hypothetical protein
MGKVPSVTSKPGHRDQGVVPQTDVFEGLVLLAVGEVGRGRLVHLIETGSRSGVPNAHQGLGILERQRLQQDTVDDAENGRVGPDTYGERQHGDGGKERRACEFSRDVTELFVDGVHESPDL